MAGIRNAYRSSALAVGGVRTESCRFNRRRYWQDVVRIRDRKIREERDAAPMELFERESAQALDAEEHPSVTGSCTNGINNMGNMLTPDSSYTRRCLRATRCTARWSPVWYARLSSSLSSSRRGWYGASAEELRSCLMEKGSRSRRESSVPATIVWNQGRPDETLMS